MAHKIAGEWRGHYVHRIRPDTGDSFSAFVRENNGHIDGTVIDDNGPSAASINGSFSFPSVVFTKVYDRPKTIKEVEKQGEQTIVTVRVYGPPVEYEGSMSDDGKSMSGTWVINGERHLIGMGTWTAYRIEEEEQKEALGTEQRVKKKKEVVGPLS